MYKGDIQSSLMEIFAKGIIDTLLGLGLGLGLEFPYILTEDVCTYPHYFWATSNL